MLTVVIADTQADDIQSQFDNLADAFHGSIKCGIYISWLFYIVGTIVAILDFRMQVLKELAVSCVVIAQGVYRC